MGMPSSNKISITHTLLSTHGFQSAELLAPKIAMLLELCVTLLSSRNSYDFGFKLIMKICNKAGKNLIDFIQQNNDKGEGEQDDIVLMDDFEDDDALNGALKNGHSANKAEKEEKILIHSLVSVMFDLLTKSDCILFESLMESAFPQNKIDWNQYTKQSEIETAANTKYTKEEQQQTSHGHDNFEYHKELHHLRVMGFRNITQCKELLNKYHGNVEAALSQLYLK